MQQILRLELDRPELPPRVIGRACQTSPSIASRTQAEAKRLLFGRVGIDVLAGHTEPLILADGTADQWIVASTRRGRPNTVPTRRPSWSPRPRTSARRCST
ncbi:MAG: histidinol dehydrogenase [Nocardioides sp.]|nr:histidinol dehydrogenase [Nocardioides sp.]